MTKQKKYEIYNSKTDEVLMWGFNEFTAMSNLLALRS